MPSDPSRFSSPAGPRSDLTRVKRAPDRGRYDSETINAFLDAGSVGHVGFVIDGRAVVIPTIYGRDGESLYLHGSIASRMMRALDGEPATMSVAHVDALVLARSAFHHSMNYRAVVVFGTACTVIDDDERWHALRVITEQMVPGRWDEVRPPNRIEMRQTAVVRLGIEEASAKTRAHGVADDEDDLGLPIWAGLVPVTTSFGMPLADPALTVEVDLPPSVATLVGV